MIKINDFNLINSIFIKYNGKLKGCAFLNRDKGIIPIELEEELDFITSYPNIMKQLIEGKEIYFKGFNAYLGEKATEGAYCEKDIFLYEYKSMNNSFFEAIINLDNQIEKTKPKTRKLLKQGLYYNE